VKFQLCNLDLKAVNLYPIGDWHIGSRQSFPRFIKELVNRIAADPEARWVSMADLIENAVVGSKSDVYLAESNPEKQVEDVVELLAPIKDKCLFMIPGNHSARTMRLAGIDPDKVIADRLGVPFHRYSVLATMVMRKLPPTRRVTCYFHHGHGGGSTPGGKINATAKARLIAPNSDAVFVGHTHITSREPVTFFDAGTKGLMRRNVYNYTIGSALTYKESYAEEKMYRPATVEQIMVRFELRGDCTFRQIYNIIQPT